MSEPFFSICIPVYNGAGTLRETICSVLGQDFTNFELCVVDNASTDATSVILSEFDDSRLRVQRNKEVLPAYENWSLAIQMATGRWTKLICADDILHPNALTRIAEAIHNHSGTQIVCGSRDVINEAGNQVLQPRRLVIAPKTMNLQQFRHWIFRAGSNPIGEAVCWTWDSRLTHQVGCFSSKWHYFIDLDYWLRLTNQSEVLLTNDHIGSFRVSQSSWTSSLGIATVTESLRFFWTHPMMDSQPIFYKIYGSVIAVVRGFARIIFLWSVLRRSVEK